MNFTQNFQLAGRFKLQRIKADTGEVVQTLEFKNLITDIGLNKLGDGPVTTYTYVSSNSTPPSVLDTSLAGFVASTATQQSLVTNPNNSSPYWTEATIVRRFGAGVAAGNLTKVGLGWTANSVGSLWSSALIVDGLGKPTVLTVLPDEFLDVSYTLRYYPPTTDSTFSVTISGVSYTFTARAANISSRIINLNERMRINSYVQVYGGPAALGAVTSTITGSTASDSPGAMTALAYVNNSLQAKGTVTVGLNAGNVAGGITALYVGASSSFMSCATQMLVSPAIPKDGTKSLSLTFAVSWSRYP